MCISINGRFKGNTTLSEIKKYACMKITKEYGIAINEGDHLIVKEKRHVKRIPLSTRYALIILLLGS